MSWDIISGWMRSGCDGPTRIDRGGFRPEPLLPCCIVEILEAARLTAYRAGNAAMVRTYWEIGRVIVEEEQKGERRAGYGDTLIRKFARHLTRDFGRGFTRSNLQYMRQFFRTFPIGHTLRGELTWTHYRLLLRVEKEEARSFYIRETIESNWSTRELGRQISSLFYERSVLRRSRQAA